MLVRLSEPIVGYLERRGMLPKFKDLTGHVFGRLVVLGRAQDYVSPSGYKQTRWTCKCSCGNIVEVNGTELKRGDTKSCGCFATDSKRKNATTHGCSKNDSLYATWKGIKSRCFNPNHKNYADYGGRGITMCDSWSESYLEFKKWCISEGYTEGLTIDRIDNYLGYCPENCRLVDRKVQANNRRNTLKITYLGETHTLSWWSEHTGIKYSTLYHRLKSGLDVKEVLKK